MAKNTSHVDTECNNIFQVGCVIPQVAKYVHVKVQISACVTNLYTFSGSPVCNGPYS